MFFFNVACLQVNIGKGIKLIINNVYVIGSDAGRNHGDPLSIEITGMGNEFSFRLFYLYFVKMPAYNSHPVRIANSYNCIRNIFGMKVDVVETPVLIYN